MRWVMLVGLLAVNCAPAAKPVMGPDGTQHININCKREIGNCYEAAAQACPHGYVTVDKGDNTQVIPATNGPIVVRKFSMLIKCK